MRQPADRTNAISPARLVKLPGLSSGVMRCPSRQANSFRLNSALRKVRTSHLSHFKSGVNCQPGLSRAMNGPNPGNLCPKCFSAQRGPCFDDQRQKAAGDQLVRNGGSKRCSVLLRAMKLIEERGRSNHPTSAQQVISASALGDAGT